MPRSSRASAQRFPDERRVKPIRMMTLQKTTIDLCTANEPRPTIGRPDPFSGLPMVGLGSFAVQRSIVVFWSVIMRIGFTRLSSGKRWALALLLLGIVAGAATVGLWLPRAEKLVGALSSTHPETA